MAVNPSLNMSLNDNHILIRPMRNEDGDAVLQIYEKGIRTKNATFETQTPSWEAWNANHISHSRFVATENGAIVGWSALTPYSSRSVYRGVLELSIYIDPDHAGKGIGSKLMNIIMESAKDSGCWMLQSSIFPENLASITLHKKFGFREVGFREKIAQLDEIWRDVILLEKRF
ncbi:GNAT family N-acetyltransferase [Paucisalibacillus sp. EB02]|uniref:GNAT family N-acetyltransferase n=1 Tax=Paucisalibacillus sp. EB02 TaxID=1347087 RepID=UPI0004B18990|nr:GNAT family N-acetyltransferase [Paucisalibacillus sp. EB02]